jgi:ectoine hydroxylase-related dioxygenase (phytanoyl-CoA dioxygenase family)
MPDLVAELQTEGYAIVRGFLSSAQIAEVSVETDKMYREGLKHHATYRHRNLLFEVLDDPKAHRRVVLQAHWTAWLSPFMEQMRRSENYFRVLEPFLGPDIKQISHQLHWKPPGAKYTSYRFHQDARFRQGSIKDFSHLRSSVTTGLAIDRQTVANGALRIMPKSHTLGYLGLSDDGPIMVGQTQDEELRRAGLDPSNMVTCEMEPGDLLLWTLFTVHGSAPNISDYDRRFMINSYVRAGDSDRGEWAFRAGVSTSLGVEPQICKYEQLRERPGPFYVDSDWTEEAKAAASRSDAALSALAMPSEARK